MVSIALEPAASRNRFTMRHFFAILGHPQARSQNEPHSCASCPMPHEAIQALMRIVGVSSQMHLARKWHRFRQTRSASILIQSSRNHLQRKTLAHLSHLGDYLRTGGHHQEEHNEVDETRENPKAEEPDNVH